MQTKQAVFGAIALLSTAGCVAIEPMSPPSQPNVARGAPHGPVVDHHQHLLSPAGAALLEKLEGGGALAPVTLPTEVADLISQRVAAWNDAAALSDLYAEDAVLVETSPIVGGTAVSQHVAQSFSRPYDIIPLAYAEDDSSRRIAALYTRGEGSDRTNIGLTMITLKQGRSGAWRIASEMMKFPGPPDYKGGDGDALIKLLDEAEIDRAVVMSTAYFFESPLLQAGAEGAAMLRAENDWTAAQVARYPQRLAGFCGVNPLTEQAISEIRRCKEQLGMVGVKLHFANSMVEMENPEHLRRMKTFFAAANRLQMPLAAHLWTTKNYGRRDSQLFLTELLPQAPDIVVQIMHMAGAGPGWTDEALEVFAAAAEAKSPSMRNVYFDVATVADQQTPAQLQLLAKRIRQIGPTRILYGSDASFGGRGTPNEGWGIFRGMVPLTDAEFSVIRDNVAPYLL